MNTYFMLQPLSHKILLLVQVAWSFLFSLYNTILDMLRCAGIIVCYGCFVTIGYIVNHRCFRVLKTII